MELVKITDKKEVEFIFIRAGLVSNDLNKNNYSAERFEKNWKNWVAFYALKNNDDVVGFAGIKKYSDTSFRIMDRYFVFPEYRNKNLRDANHLRFFIHEMLNFCKEHGAYAWHSSEKRNSLRYAANFISNYTGVEMEVLDKTYCTIPGLEDNPKCIQYISTQKGIIPPLKQVDK